MCLFDFLPALSIMYKTSYPTLRCACGGRTERPQMVYANDNIYKFNSPRKISTQLISMGSSSVICWMVFHMMTHAPLTWAYQINCYFNGQVIGSRRQISLARNVEKRHPFWGARALGSWQSIQIACRLQESVREDTGWRFLHVVRIELTARSHILVSWSVSQLWISLL